MTLDLYNINLDSDKTASKGLFFNIKTIMEIIAKLYGGGKDKPLVIFVDEYDTPLQSVAKSSDDIKLVLGSLTSFLRKIFKYNELLFRGALIGIEKITASNFYSSFNNSMKN